MSSKSTKGSAKPASIATQRLKETQGKESKVIKKSTGPSLDKLQKENEDLRKQLRVASGQLAYLRENLDPSAFRKAAGITSMDGNHMYDDALKSAEEIINKQKCELEELQRNKQSRAKEMDGKTRNEKDVSKDGGNATLKAELDKLKEQIKKLTTQLSEAERNNRQEIVQLESKIEILKKGRDNLKEKLIHINRKIPQFFSQRPIKGTAPAVPDSSDEIKRLKDENENITKQAKADVSKLESELQKVKLDLEQTKQKLSNSLKEEQKLNTQVDAYHAKADQNTTNASQSSTSESNTIKNLEKEIGRLQDGMNKLQSERNNVAQAKSTWERERENLLKQLSDLKKESNETTKRKDEKYDEPLKKHQAEMEKLRKENDATVDKKDNEISKLQNEKKDLENKREDLLKQLSDLEKESKETTKRNEEKYDETVKKHQAEMEKLRKEKDETRDKKDNEISKLQDEKKDLEKEISQLKKDLENRKKASPPRRDQTHDEGNEEFRKKLKDAQEEITELRNRLSKVVGAKISDDNPNITDLSDENRPTKLAEKYSELYDNEWTDAYEDADREGLDEKKSIKKLLGILTDVDDECRSMANDFKNNIKRAALSLSENGSNMKETKVDVTRNKLLKEMQKSFAPLLVDDVYKNLVKKNKLKLQKDTERFYRSCVELCWLMSVQDPPVVFDTPKTGGKFDSDRYRTYTKTGKQLDYVVWPSMLLHAGGPLLAKGVAQGI